MSDSPMPFLPRAGGGRAGRRDSARAATRVLAVLLAALAALMVTVPSAAAPPTPTPSANSASSSPTPGTTSTSSGVGVGLGPGAPSPSGSTPSSGASTGSGSSGDSSPGVFDIPGQIQKALDDWFASLVTDALNPMLNLLGSTVLGTPDVTTMPRVEQLWEAMAVLANSFYVLLILAGGVIVMTHETLQTRYSAKQIAPRLVAGLLIGNASLALLGLIIRLADALASGIMGQGLDPAQAGQALAKMVTAGPGGIFSALLGVCAAVLAVVLVVTFLMRLSLLVLLAVAAPIALACHALPHTEGLARLWWRAVLGTLGVQLGQALTLVTALRVILDPGGESALGFPTGGGLTDLLVFVALFLILIKIPFWVGKSIFGPSRLLGLAKTVATYQLMGAAGLGMRRAGSKTSTRPATGRTKGPHPPAGPASLTSGSGRGPRPGGPRPGSSGSQGSSGGSRITVTQVHPEPPRPRVIDGELAGPRAVPAVGRRPAAQLPRGSGSPNAARGRGGARGVQRGLFPPPRRTPLTRAAEVPDPPPFTTTGRPPFRQPVLFDRHGQITPAAAPPPPSANAPAAPTRGATSTSSSPARTSAPAPAPVRARPEPAPAKNPAAAAPRATTAARRPVKPAKPTPPGGTR
jgi:hypothetical protein